MNLLKTMGYNLRGIFLHSDTFLSTYMVLYQSNFLKQNLVLLAIILVYHLWYACQWITISGLGCSISGKYTHKYFSFFIICQQTSYMLPQVSFIF